MGCEKQDPIKEEQVKMDDENDTRCGIGCFKPQWIQKLADPKLFFLNYCVLAVLQGAQFTYLVGCLSTLEKRYAYESKISGLIMIADEFSPILFGMAIGYFGGKSHRPRLMAGGMMAAVLSAYVSAIPYFIYGRAEHLTSISSSVHQNRSKFEICDYQEKPEVCNNSPTIPAVSLLFLGNFLKGLGGLAFYTIGTTYLDDSVQKKNSPVYFGTLLALRMLGPATGFLLVSFCLQYYEDPTYYPGFSQNDPRWVGAWWLGFVILGTAVFIVSLPIMLFPRRFSGRKLPTTLKTKSPGDKVLSPLQQIKGLKNAAGRMLKNPILLFHSLGGVLRINGVMGYFILLPRYMETQFRQSASKASLYAGPTSTVSMQMGALIGGLAVKRLRPNPRQLTGYIVFAETFTVLGMVICMFLFCPSINMNGAVLEGSTLRLENQCNTGCLCTTRVFTPVCGPDNSSTYFSPCFAGCSVYNKSKNKEEFSECECVHDKSGLFTRGVVEKGYCPTDCGWMISFIIVISLGKLISSTARVGDTLVALRCVNPEDKSIAIGTIQGAFSLLGFLPYPLIFGALSDASCLVWEESCGQRGNCWLYDSNKFRYYLHGVPSAFIILGSMTDLLVWYYSPRIKNLYDDGDTVSDSDDKAEKDGVGSDILKMKVLGNSTASVKDTDKEKQSKDPA